MAPNVEEFNEDELEAPQWLNEDFITKTLKKLNTDETDLKVKTLKLTPGAGKGDHFASVMFRGSVEYEESGENKSISFIIKILPEVEGDKKELLKDSKLFETEIGVYSDVLPKFERILRSVGDETVLGPRCIDCGLSPKKFIIFEDIVPLGYAVIRNRPVNTQEFKAAYSKLAKWHAVGYKTALEEPRFFDKYRYGILAKKDDSNWKQEENNFLTSGIGNFITLLNSQPTFTKYKPYFESIQSDLLEKCKDSFNSFFGNHQEGTLYGLCHGDFHARNMMFKHNSESKALEDVMLLDYQLSYMGPIVNDLFYSRFMLLDSEHRIEKFDELVEFYFDVFRDTLERIGFDGPLPTLEILKKELWKNRHFEIYLLITFLPLAVLFYKGNFEPGVLTDPKDRTRLMFLSNDDYVRELQVLLPKYEKLGYFNQN